MPNTKALRSRIKSVSSTLQLTKAMGLVASSKIYRANLAMQRARQYSAAFDKAIAQLTTDSECLKSPYMKKSENEEEKICLVVIAGDRGLAGGYNANVFRLVNTFPGAQIVAIGKRACDRYGQEINSSEDFSFDMAREIADKLCTEFAQGKFTKLGVIYTRYVSMMTQEADVCWLLPLEQQENKGQASAVYEPDPVTVLNYTVREYVAGILSACVRESFASEVSARRMAMDSAGKNAKEMIDDLQLQYNRARQGAITQEITEIVAGSGQ